MDDLKQILKMYFEGYSQRQISDRLKRSRNTDAEVVKSTMKNQLSLENIVDLSEDELNSLLFPEKKYLPEYVQPDYEYCHKELLKDGVTQSLLYEEYVAQCKNQHKPFYKRTQFFDKYADYVKKHRLTMHINHKRLTGSWLTGTALRWEYATNIPERSQQRISSSAHCRSVCFPMYRLVRQ